MNYNLVQVAEWILSNRRGKAFVDYTFGQILGELTASSKAQSGLVVHIDDEIVGVVTSVIDHEEKLCYVQNVLANPNVIKFMIQYFIQAYPEYKLHGIRHGKDKFIRNLQLIENKL